MEREDKDKRRKRLQRNQYAKALERNRFRQRVKYHKRYEPTTSELMKEMGYEG